MLSSFLKSEDTSAFFKSFGKLPSSTSLLQNSVRGKQNRSALVFNIFEGIDSYGEAFLGFRFCSCFNISSTVAFLNEKFLELRTDSRILRILECD